MATLLGSADDVETKFYAALQEADIERLMALWADLDDVVCVHPSGERAIGPAAIRGSFESIFTGGGVHIRPGQLRRLAWAGGELHHLVEQIGVLTPQGLQQAWVLASNLYVETSLGWRLVLHHASPAAAQEPAQPADDPPGALH